MTVKVILRQAVDHLGDPGEIVSVAPGYARNYLLPKRMALEATPGNLKVVEQQRRMFEAREAKELDAARAIVERINKVELTVKKKAGEGGTLYGSVTKPEIVTMLAAQGVDVDRRQLGRDEPIKAVGTYEISIKVHRKLSAMIKLHVESENPPPVIEEPPEVDLDEAEE